MLLKIIQDLEAAVCEEYPEQKQPEPNNSSNVFFNHLNGQSPDSKPNTHGLKIITGMDNEKNHIYADIYQVLQYHFNDLDRRLKRLENIAYIHDTASFDADLMEKIYSLANPVRRPTDSMKGLSSLALNFDLEKRALNTIKSKLETDWAITVSPQQ